MITHSIRYRAKFNLAIKSLTDYIFNPNTITFDYIKSNSENFIKQRYKILDPRIYDNIIDYIDENEEGLLENTLYTHIISQDKSVLILTGASGSGKTSVLRYVINNLKKSNTCNEAECHRYSLCKIRKKEIQVFDFLELENTNSNLLERFEFELNAYLNLAIEKCLGNGDLFKEFLSNLKATKDPQLNNLKLMLTPINPRWKVDTVLAKITKNEQLNYSNKNIILKSILHYFRLQYPEVNQGCFTLVFDNIDKLRDEEQTEIIKYIYSLHNRIKCNLVITSRLTTLSKIDDRFSNTSSIIENAGPQPVKILYHRCKYYLDNKNTLLDIISTRREIENKSEQNKKYLERFDYVLQLLKDYLSPIDDIIGLENEDYQQFNRKKKQIQKTLSAFSGLSIRRCLEISRRFIETYTYAYDVEPTANQLQSSLSYQCVNGIKFHDKYITNIYGLKDSKKNSWLLYRILNILIETQKNKIDLSLGQLYDVITLFNDLISEDIFITSINTLINSDKRLAYVSGFSSVSEIDRTSNNTQKIHITNCGKEYFTYLSTELTYIQNSFAALDWSIIEFDNKEFNKLSNTVKKNLIESESNLIINSLHEYLNSSYNEDMVFDINKISERMQCIRIGLDFFLHHDILESYNYNKRKQDKDYIYNILNIIRYSEHINNFPTFRVALNIGDSFLRILKSFLRKKINILFVLPEIKQWQSFLYQVHLWNTVFKSKQEKKYYNIEEEIKKLINDIQIQNLNNS